MADTPSPLNLAKALRDNSFGHCVLVFQNITMISLMEAMQTKGQILNADRYDSSNMTQCKG